MQRLGALAAFKERTLIVKGADVATLRGWTGVPNFILESTAIPIGAKLTYAMLLKYAREQDECFPGQERLAQDMGVSERSVRTWLQHLQEAKLVTVRRRGQGRSNLYTVYLKASFWKISRHTR